MKKDVTISVEADLYDKFCMAVNLSNKTQDEAVSDCMSWYISKVFARVSQEYSSPSVEKSGSDTKDFYGKAISRIPLWALKPSQYNHKIIRAYFMAVDIAGEATLTMMERLCSDKDQPDLYVPTFKNNYAQMKLDGPKTHGKVFEDDGNNVWIWNEVEDTLMKYKSSFYVSEE